MSSFFEELKRRKVYRVAVGYLVAGWLIIQVAATIFPILGLPDWGERLVVSVVLIGFPLALFLAWAFDVTPEGIQATPSLPVAPEIGPCISYRPVILVPLFQKYPINSMALLPFRKCLNEIPPPSQTLTPSAVR